MLQKNLIFCKNCYLIFLFFYSSFAFAADKILLFESNIHIQNNHSLLISEIISTYQSTPQQGLFFTRSLPLTLSNSNQQWVYEVQKVLLNNEKVPYQTEIKNNQFIILITPPANHFTPGIYLYNVEYQAKRAVDKTNIKNELTWNSTGNWPSPLLKASIQVDLPEEMIPSKYSGYTNENNQKRKKFVSRLISPSQITYLTTEPLLPGESLIIAIEWQKKFT